MGSDQGHHVDVAAHVRKYKIVFAALTAGTILTVAASYLPVSFTGHVVIALLIATIKGTLVAAYFMHLISERMALYSVLIGTFVMFVALLALPLMTHNEMVHHPQIALHLSAAPAQAHGSGDAKAGGSAAGGAVHGTDGAQGGGH